MLSLRFWPESRNGNCEHPLSLKLQRTRQPITALSSVALAKEEAIFRDEESGQKRGDRWSPHRGLNPGPRPYQGRALPLSYTGGTGEEGFNRAIFGKDEEREL